MSSIVIYFTFLIVAVYGSGEVTFIHHPKGVTFSGNEIANESDLKEIFSASLGFTTSQDSSWSGLQVSNPFNYAEAVVVLVIDGIKVVDDIEGHHFTMNTDEDEDLIWLTMERRVRNRYPSQNNTLMRIDLSNGVDAVAPFYHLLPDFETPNMLKVEFLDLDITEDRDFVAEVSLLQEIVNKVEMGSISQDGIPDIYWFVLRGLHAVYDWHDPDELATREAKKILMETINQTSNAFNKAYDGKVLFSLITSDVSHTRRIREAKSDVNLALRLNTAPLTTPDRLAIYNIVLWSMVVLVMSIIAICVYTMRMDPGRDSIIYRMTAMKPMKKEN